MYLGDLILQIPGLAPAYTKHPIFPDLFSAMIIAALISIGLNFAFTMLRKETTDAIRKQDKVRISELKKKQAYVNKMSLEMQQQQMRPMMLYMIPSFMLWILVFPALFGQTVALSPIHIPYLMCTDENVKVDSVIDEKGEPKGACNVAGEVFLWGWFLITSLGTSGIIGKITKTSLPSMT